MNKIQAHLRNTATAMMLLLSIQLYSQQTLNQGNKLYSQYAYSSAIEQYEAYFAKHSGNYEATWKLADSYRENNRYADAEKWYAKAVAFAECEPVNKLHYAQVLQINGNYALAAEWYGKYLQTVPKDGRAESQLKACQNYKQYFEGKDRYVVTNMNFNSKYYDYSPAQYKEGLVYSSSRDSEKAISNISTWTGEQFFDLYYTAGKGDETGGSWGKPKLVGGPINTKYHEGPVVFSRDDKQVYVTRNNYDNRRMIGKVGKSEDNVVMLKLYIADIEGDNWKNEKEFKYNNDEYSVGHPALSADGNLLYFVSDMPGGFGGTDIYVCERAGSEWLAPKNAGPEINTEGDEMFPWISEDSVLYFASEGHGGLGGLDVFRVKGEPGSWGRVKNMGSPINSPQDDFGLIIDKEDKSRGYFTSDRVEGKGSDDIYSFKDNGIYLEGIVVDAKTDSPICKSTVDLRLSGNVKGRANTECDGYFEFSVVSDKVYNLKGCAEGYKCNEVGASTEGVQPGETVFVKIPLDREEKVNLEVLVIDKQTREPIGGSAVVVKGRCDNTEQRGTSDPGGMSYYEGKINCDYPVSASAQGYKPGSTEVTTVGVPANSTVKAIVELEKIIDDKPVLLDIYYDFDKWNIRVPESENELNKLLGFLEANPGSIVEIGSHTDARAPFDYNIRLSQRRAQSVVDWLTARGIAKDRLKAVGYGETRPVNQCTDNVKCSEEEHQLNRRTEFRVIGNNIDIRSQRKTNIIVDPCKKCPF